MTDEIDVDDILLDADDRMEKSVEALINDLRTIRTGRATPALVEHIPVMYYGSPTALKQLAQISIPEPRLIAIRPFSAGDIGEIQKSILRSDLGITPNNDGKTIRLVIPALTEERRRDLVKQVHKRTEEGRISVRNVGRDAKSNLKKLETQKKITEDDLEGSLEEVQEMVDKAIKRIDEIGRVKEAEIMEV